VDSFPDFANERITMSLEDALNRNSDLLEKHNALLEKVLAGGKTAAPAANKPAASKPAADKAASKPAASKPAADKAAAGKKTPSTAVISQRFADYMKAGDEDDRNAAKANVRSLVEHYGAPKLTEIDPQHFPRLLEYLDAWEAGESVEFDELEGGDEDGDEEGGESLL
jgi:predicted lipid-binding transport protein (Tim44 family)